MESFQKVERVALAAHDAGGARAIFPVAAELQRRGVATLALLAGPAEKIWREETTGLTAFTTSDDASVESLAEQLGASGAQVLLAASGLYNQFEHTVRLAARRVGIPIVAALDSWLNYGERFEREKDGVVGRSRPDRVCAIDDWTREGLLAAGFAPSSVFVTGHPDLEKTVRDCQALSAEEIRAARHVNGVSGDGLLVVFLSDPFYEGPNLKFHVGPGATIYPDGSPIFGYTVFDVLPAVLKELDAALIAQDTTCDLIIRPHPWEHEEALHMILAQTHVERVRVRIERGFTVAHWIQCADVFVGMMTIALLHAALAGKPSISVELGLPASGQSDPCISNNLGYTHGVFDLPALRIVCRQIAERNWPALKTSPRYPLPLGGAAARVADVVLGCVVDPVLT